MRLTRFVCGAALAAVLLAAGAPALAQDAGKMDEKAMMEAYMKAGAPGEPHKLLAKFAGTWTTSMRAWMAPGQPPVEAKGTAEVKTIFDGRFTQEDFSGEFMGTPFTGLSLTGYDNTEKRYVSTWIDNMSTHLMTMYGTYDPAARTYTFTGEHVDPVAGKKTTKILIRWLDDDKHVSEFHEMAADGKWVKTMELVYTRK